MEYNIHKGHRDRLRKEFLSNPNRSELPDHKLLEMLLFYGVPQKNTNELAHKLIDAFGSFHAVFEADITDLVSVTGMTKNAAALIKLMLPVATAYINDKYEDEICLSSSEEIGNYILKKFFGTSLERCALLCLNNNGKILSFEFLAEGDVESVGVSARTVAQRALKVGATTVVIAHNHPAGIALPSLADQLQTVRIRDALQTVSVRLTDHIIVAGDDYVSMAQSARFKELFL